MPERATHESEIAIAALRRSLDLWRRAPDVTLDGADCPAVDNERGAMDRSGAVGGQIGTELPAF